MKKLSKLHCASNSGLKKLMIFISFSEAYARFDNKNHKFNYTFKKRWKNIFTTSQSDENR